MSTENQKSTTETPSSQGGVICRFNLKSGSVKFYSSLDELSNSINRSNQHCLTLIKELQLFNNKYAFYFLNDIFKNKGKNEFKIKLPKRYIQKVLANEKTNKTKLLLERIKNYYPERFKGVEVYIIDKDGKIIEILEGEKAVAENFSIPIGTVKSRLHRIDDLDKAIKYGMIKKSTFDRIYL